MILLEYAKDAYTEFDYLILLNWIYLDNNHIFPICLEPNWNVFMDCKNNPHHSYIRLRD